jgi:acetate kinase
MLGISGTSNDMRDLLASRPGGALAVDYFVYQAAKHTMLAVLGGVDALVLPPDR